MYEPTIVVPSSRFVKKCDWALELADGHEPAAEILVSVFLYHYDNRLANRILVELVARVLRRKNVGFQHIGDWLPYSMSYLGELLFNTHGRVQIIAGVELLEKKEFISTQVPSEIAEFYSRNHTWVRVEIANIKTWLNKVYLPNRRSSGVPTTQWEEVKSTIEKISLVEADDAFLDDLEVKEPKAVVKQELESTEEFSGVLPLRVVKTHNKKQELEQNVKIICAFHKHITGKRDDYIYDKERCAMIRARLKEGRSIVKCALAILGNSVSDFYQGRDEKNMVGVRNKQGYLGKVLDEVRHIFESAETFEKMIREADYYADIHDTTAKNELENFLKGTPSKYAKKQKQSGQNASIERIGIDALDYQERVVYMNFAGAVASYFKTLQASDVLELAQTNKSLLAQGKEIKDAEILMEALIECYKAYDSFLSKSVKDEMRKFCVKIVEFMKYN
jgi:hypothetical protein